MSSSSRVVGQFAIEGRRMVALVENEPNVPCAVDCEAAADGSLTMLGPPVDIDTVIDATKRAVAGKSPPGSVTAELRNLRLALLGLVCILENVAKTGGGE